MRVQRPLNGCVELDLNNKLLYLLEVPAILSGDGVSPSNDN